LRAYREIIGLAAAQMKPGAYLVLEIGYDQRREVSDLLSEVGFADLDVRRDLGGHDRALSGRKL
ncbi:MAG: peptide chain release factor N(5)-glutamine methyltransferase, partial [Pseudomonadota bacterium]